VFLVTHDIVRRHLDAISRLLEGEPDLPAA
jgi:hypothetical protein